MCFYPVFGNFSPSLDPISSRRSLNAVGKFNPVACSRFEFSTFWQIFHFFADFAQKFSTYPHTEKTPVCKP